MIISSAGMPRSTSTVIFNWMLDLLNTQRLKSFYNAGNIGFDGYHHESYRKLLAAIDGNDYDHTIFKTHTLPRQAALELLVGRDHLTIFTIRNITDSTKSLIGFFSNYYKDRSTVIKMVIEQMQQCLVSMKDNYELYTIIPYNDMITDPSKVLTFLIDKLRFDIPTDVIHTSVEQYALKNVITMLESMPASQDSLRCWHKTHLVADADLKQEIMCDFDNIIAAITPHVESVAYSTGIDLFSL